MQGPRFSSHRSGGIELPVLTPPKELASYNGPPPPPLLEDDKPDDVPPPSWRDRLLKLKRTLQRHGQFVGPGLVASVAFIDPGNWSTDLQAGSQYGYSHLFIILLSGFIALLFQILSTRLGAVSGQDLSVHCRNALHDRPRYKMFYRWGMLYPLYAITELAIIATDLAELLGSAIAINLLFPAIPLYAAVLLTSTDVLLILLLFNKYPTTVVTRSMRIFELVLGLMVMAVLGSFVALLVKVSPVWRDVFLGYVPGPSIIAPGALYISVGILGATCMPHAFFIGSKMATMRRLNPSQYGEIDPEPTPTEVAPLATGGPMLHLPQPVYVGNLMSPTLPLARSSSTEQEKPSYVAPPPEPKPTLACINAHLTHAVWDITGSLLGFAVVINSAILILAAAVFYYGEASSSTPAGGITDLFDAYDLVKEYIGPVFAALFAIALLASGQAASITVTLSGQIISEGFIEWRTTPWKRRLITRSIGIVPSLAVSIAVGRQGIDVLLVGSQVALSIILPFAIAPLVIFTSQHSIMSVPKTVRPVDEDKLSPTPSSDLESSTFVATTPQFWPTSFAELKHALNPLRRRHAKDPEYVSFANGMAIIYLATTVWGMIVIANIFAFTQD